MCFLFRLVPYSSGSLSQRKKDEQITVSLSLLSIYKTSFPYDTSLLISREEITGNRGMKVECTFTEYTYT